MYLIYFFVKAYKEKDFSPFWALTFVNNRYQVSGRRRMKAEIEHGNISKFTIRIVVVPARPLTDSVYLVER